MSARGVGVVDQQDSTALNLLAHAPVGPSARPVAPDRSRSRHDGVGDLRGETRHHPKGPSERMLLLLLLCRAVTGRDRHDHVESPGSDTALVGLEEITQELRETELLTPGYGIRAALVLLERGVEAGADRGERNRGYGPQTFTELAFEDPATAAGNRTGPFKRPATDAAHLRARWPDREAGMFEAAHGVRPWDRVAAAEPRARIWVPGVCSVGSVARVPCAPLVARVPRVPWAPLVRHGAKDDRGL